jgi:hypothetical protein
MAERLPDHMRQNVIEQLQQLREAGDLVRADHAKKLASTADAVITRKGGMDLLSEHIGEITEAGFFAGTSWEDPAILNSSLVGGTLKAGGLTTVYEILSELRILAIAEGRMNSAAMSRTGARDFLENLTVTNLDLLFPDASEELRSVDSGTRKRIAALFEYLRSRFIRWDRIGKRVAEELQMICSQRPIVTDRARSIIRMVRENMGGNGSQSVEIAEHSSRLRSFVHALYAPSKMAGKLPPEEYEKWLDGLRPVGPAGLARDRSVPVSSAQDSSAPDESTPDADTLRKECEELAGTLRRTGLSSPWHTLLLRRVKESPTLTGTLLGLNAHGKAELKTHHPKVSRYIDLACHPDTSRFVYGLACMLERNLLSRQPVAVGLEQLESMKMHPEQARAVSQAHPDSTCSPHQHLFADAICMLGQPLGVGQGWNPTCQSARGMSLWSRHAPGKLLTMIHTAATTNDLEMRFEGELLASSRLTEGLATEFDYKLDAVSIVLVPHLDRIYFEMMRLATGRGEDPHKWVNPAMYGQWIPTGFSTPYNYLTNTITGYGDFLRLFYTTHHPDYNGGHDLAYPNPVGIFLTAANGKLLGFHAVSILRVARWQEGFRVYFLNPNNEGRQKWQSDIQPTVAGHGEVPGESSLPFHQFASRLYAFHYRPSGTDDRDMVPDSEIDRVTAIAQSSWGTSYVWQDIPQTALM